MAVIFLPKCDNSYTTRRLSCVTEEIDIDEDFEKAEREGLYVCASRGFSYAELEHCSTKKWAFAKIRVDTEDDYIDHIGEGYRNSGDTGTPDLTKQEWILRGIVRNPDCVSVEDCQIWTELSSLTKQPRPCRCDAFKNQTYPSVLVQVTWTPDGGVYEPDVCWLKCCFWNGRETFVRPSNPVEQEEFYKYGTTVKGGFFIQQWHRSRFAMFYSSGNPNTGLVLRAGWDYDHSKRYNQTVIYPPAGYFQITTKNSWNNVMTVKANGVNSGATYAYCLFERDVPERRFVCEPLVDNTDPNLSGINIKQGTGVIDDGYFGILRNVPDGEGRTVSYRFRKGTGW